MSRAEYYREYHRKHRERRLKQMLARYYANGGHKGRLLREASRCDT